MHRMLTYYRITKLIIISALFGHLTSIGSRFISYIYSVLTVHLLIHFDTTTS